MVASRDSGPLERRRSRVRRDCAHLALVVLTALPGAAAGDDATTAAPSPRRESVEEVEHRVYVAPGARFGASAQALSLDLGRAAITRNDPSRTPSRRGGVWRAFGVRVEGVAHSWSPAAAQGVGYLSGGGWSWEWWPVGAEIAIGGGRGGARSYGLLQLSWLFVVTSRFEAFATYQAPFGAVVARPEWLPSWTFGARIAFDVARPRRERVTRAPAGEATNR
jgi:hypothetical protein